MSKQIYFNNNVARTFCYMIVMFPKYLLIVMPLLTMLYNITDFSS